MGIRADESDREGIQVTGDVVRRFPLVEWGWGLADVLGYLERREVAVPDRTDCGSCFFQTLGEWHRLWLEHPDRYARYEEQERKTGHTFRSPQRDTQPAALALLRVQFELGYEPKRTRMSDRKAMCSTCAH